MSKIILLTIYRLAGKAILFNTSLKHTSINFFTIFAGLFSAQHLPCFGVDVYFSTFAKHSSYRINETVCIYMGCP